VFTSNGPARLCMILCVGSLLLLRAGGHPPRKLQFVVLSYSEESSFCEGCPHFRVELRQGSYVTLFGLARCAIPGELARCAIPGEHHYRVPEAVFPALLAEYDGAGFISAPRLDGGSIQSDVLVKRIGYRDETKIHEVVDAIRNRPALTTLEKDIRELTQADRYLTPSVNLYRELIQSGWNVNTLGQDHENALVAAAGASDAESIALLLEHGAVVSTLALETAVYSKSIEVFRRLAAAKKFDATSGEGERLLIAAAAAQNLPVVRELLDHGATHLTALLGASPDHLEIARLFIDRGADVNARDEQGQTLLFRVASSVNTGMIELLASHGADVNMRDRAGRTALMTASGLCWYWNVKALLAHGADPAIRDNRGRTALEPDYVSPGDPKCAVSLQLLKAAGGASH